MIVQSQLRNAQLELALETAKPTNAVFGRIIYCTDSRKVYLGTGLGWSPLTYGLEAGYIKMFSGISAPLGWLVLTGQTVLEATFQILANRAKDEGWFSDGGTPGNFLLPDLRGRFLNAVDTTGGTIDLSYASRVKLGLGDIFSYQPDQLTNHTHSYLRQENPISADNSSAFTPRNRSFVSLGSGFSGGTENRIKNISINWIIKT